MRIAVVGYGIAGIAAAIFLRRLGHTVTHFERSPRPGASGAGLLLNSAGLAILDRLGLREEALARGSIVTRLQGQTRAGRPVIDLRYADISPESRGLGIQRSALFELLRSADTHFADLRSGLAAVAVDAEAGLLFGPGEARFGPFELIVAADGSQSLIRRCLPALLRRDRPAPWAALVGLIDDPGQLAGDRLFQSFAGPRHVAFWPVGTRAGEATPRLAVSLNVPFDGSSRVPDAASWRQTVASVCPRLSELLEQTSRDPELIFYSYRDVDLRSYVAKRVVLIGDAAHSMSPALGQGAGMALLDAASLGDALEAERDLVAALAAFDRCRRAAVAPYQRLSRWATPLFQSPSRMVAMLRDHAVFPLSKLPGVGRSMLKVLDGHDLR